jgi:Rap1a immunity proteins
MRACARVALVSLAMSPSLGLAGCGLSDTVSGWFAAIMTDEAKPTRKLYRPQTAKPRSAPAQASRLQAPSPSAPTSAGRTSPAMSMQDWLSMRDWLNLCQEGRTTEQAIKCFAYTRGYADALQFWWLVAEDTAKICIPSETTSEELRDVGVAWIRKEVKDPSEPIGENLALAFFNKWRCKKEK